MGDIDAMEKLVYSHTQSDSKARVVALTNLRAMCARVSGTCHTFQVIKVSTHRVAVAYSNPDEYGTPHPVTAHYPCYPSPFDSATPLVVLEMVRCTGGDDESWQAFESLHECQQLFRSCGSPCEWQTEYEARLVRHPEFTVSSSWDKDGCLQTWHLQGRDFRSWRESQDRAAEQMRNLDQEKARQ